MAKRQTTLALEIPDRVNDETITVRTGETAYWLLLSDEEVEVLKDGICPERIAQAAWNMLDWKRRGARMLAREKAAS